MNAVADGRMIPLSDLDQVTDWSSIKKVCHLLPTFQTLLTNPNLIIQLHKLEAEPAIINAAGNVACERAIIDNIVTSSVGMKSVMA